VRGGFTGAHVGIALVDLEGIGYALHPAKRVALR
jgi:hypothetical protein